MPPSLRVNTPTRKWFSKHEQKKEKTLGSSCPRLNGSSLIKRANFSCPSQPGSMRFSGKGRILTGRRIWGIRSAAIFQESGTCCQGVLREVGAGGGQTSRRPVPAREGLPDPKALPERAQGCGVRLVPGSGQFGILLDKSFSSFQIVCVIP